MLLLPNAMYYYSQVLHGSWPQVQWRNSSVAERWDSSISKRRDSLCGGVHLSRSLIQEEVVCSNWTVTLQHLSNVQRWTASGASLPGLVQEVL